MPVVTNTSAGVLAPKVAVAGQPLSEELLADLIELRIDLTISMPAQLTMRFADWEGVHVKTAIGKLGTEIVVSLPTGSAATASQGDLPSFETTEVGFEAASGDVAELVVVAHDRSHRMGVGTSVKSYVKMSTKDIVAERAQVSKLEFRSNLRNAAFTAQMPYLMLADSDLGLVNELTGRLGLVWWVGPRHTMVVAEPGGRGEVELAYMDQLRALSVRLSGRHPSEVQVSGWDHTTMKGVSGKAKTTAALSTDLSGGKGMPGPPLVVTGARAIDQAEANALATALAHRVDDRRLNVNGTCVLEPRLLPGMKVKIVDFPGAPGQYDVHRVEHVFTPTEAFKTRFWAGQAPAALARGTVDRSSSIQFGGIVVGVITDNNDPDKLGRVKLKFPWLNDAEASEWARVVGFGGGVGTKGKARGAHFVPEVNDEVMVGFEGGDLRKPVVLGTVFNGKTSAPVYQRSGEGKIDNRTITSRLGHIFEMGDGDQPSKSHLLLALADGKTRVRVGKDRIDVESPAGVPIALKSGQASITITNAGDITIAGNKVTIDAKMDVAITAGLQLNAKGKVAANIESDSKMVVKGAMTDVGGAGVTSVKGAMVKIN